MIFLVRTNWTKFLHSKTAKVFGLYLFLGDLEMFNGLIFDMFDPYELGRYDKNLRKIQRLDCEKWLFLFELVDLNFCTARFLMCSV
jgi:hypothetical protein